MADLSGHNINCLVGKITGDGATSTLEELLQLAPNDLILLTGRIPVLVQKGQHPIECVLSQARVRPWPGRAGRDGRDPLVVRFMEQPVAVWSALRFSMRGKSIDAFDISDVLHATAPHQVVSNLTGG